VSAETFEFGADLTSAGRRAIGTFVGLASHEPILNAVAQANKEADRCGSEAPRIRTLISVVRDLLAHGWVFTEERKTIRAVYSPIQSGSKKDAVRDVQLAQRERQLLKPSVREFIRSMEKRRLGPTGWCSVYSLIRDGRKLAASLRDAVADCKPLVPTVIEPYIQFVQSVDERCKFTGLRLMDIWRYFRYTWAMPYNSVPGRSMLILVRDAAAESHPVIGIAALGSAVAQLSVRDQWIGWHPEAFLRQTRLRPTARVARWLLRRLALAQAAIYKPDLLKRRIVKQHELAKPTTETFKRLRAAAKEAWDGITLRQTSVSTRSGFTSPVIGGGRV
jgi:hypothetical protein